MGKKKKSKQRAGQLQPEQTVSAAGTPPSPAVSVSGASAILNNVAGPSTQSSVNPRGPLDETRAVARKYLANGVYDFRLDPAQEIYEQDTSGEWTLRPIDPPSSSLMKPGPEPGSSSSSSPRGTDRAHKKARSGPSPPRWSPPPNNSRSRSITPEFTPGLPSEEYLEASLQPSLLLPSFDNDPSSPAGRKLLILDLNGTLVYRSPRNKTHRTITPRPYMGCFTRWVTDPRSGLATMIWSSARPENVHKMAVTCFGTEGVDRLTAIWARDTLGLSKRDYDRKVQTVKDLKLIWTKLPFSAANTILLDDSALKAHLQPYNHLILTEYDAQMMNVDRQFASQSISDCTAAEGSGDAEPLVLEHDQTLLAVIGILSAMVRQTHVAGWMRAGGLWGTASSGSGAHHNPGPNSCDEPDQDQQSCHEDAGEATSPHKRKREPTPPASEQHLQANVDRGPGAVMGIERKTSVSRLWYDDPAVFSEWVGQGRAELGRLEIPIVHGLGKEKSEELNVQV